ncbi:transcription antiterminator BglG [Lactococcus hodotermopsidis]|uniref:Transcription antiterminator BglG n=1 Tax=Pseudolactococcus hodotermopsidis TaxID=2709157 RepID=A0A6A0BAW8_9LACT|nr:PRD domain-containing protein [Lactococcus hodotermopsidis]GFH41601.1 transcription antiterminator BglG [Lactococcus hodotermopsidis]
MEIKKILNNNVVITQKGNSEVVAMGRGIAFGKKIGDNLSAEKIEKLYELAGNESSRVTDLLSEIPDEILEISDDIATLAKETIKGKINDSLFLTLADHINGVLVRVKENVAIKNFLLWDIKRFFPEEYALGKKAVAEISEKLNLALSDDEAGFIAMHIVNSELENESSSAASELTMLIEEIVTIVKYSLQVSLNEDDIYFQRFMTHIKFFAERVLSSTTENCSKDEDSLFDMVVQKYPEAYETTKKITGFLLKNRNYKVSHDEQMYITIHLARIIEKD